MDGNQPVILQKKISLNIEKDRMNTLLIKLLAESNFPSEQLNSSFGEGNTV